MYQVWDVLDRGGYGLTQDHGTVEALDRDLAETPRCGVSRVKNLDFGGLLLGLLHNLSQIA